MSRRSLIHDLPSTMYTFRMASVITRNCRLSPARTENDTAAPNRPSLSIRCDMTYKTVSNRNVSAIGNSLDKSPSSRPRDGILRQHVARFPPCPARLTGCLPPQLHQRPCRHCLILVSERESAVRRVTAPRASFRFQYHPRSPNSCTRCSSIPVSRARIRRILSPCSHGCAVQSCRAGQLDSIVVYSGLTRPRRHPRGPTCQADPLDVPLAKYPVHSSSSKPADNQRCIKDQPLHIPA